MCEFDIGLNSDISYCVLAIVYDGCFYFALRAHTPKINSGNHTLSVLLYLEQGRYAQALGPAHKILS